MVFGHVDLDDADAVVELLREAAEANEGSALRQGALVHPPRRGRLTVAGDLHDHGPNLMRLIRLAALTDGPDRRLLLQEIIHGPHRVNGRDLSARTLMRVASLQLAFPDQVHVILGNHELAQLTRRPIVKHGVNMVEAFDDGIEAMYDSRAEDVRWAMDRYFESLPLGVRCPNGILCTHSLPGPSQRDAFDPTILDRATTQEDRVKGGSAYLLVWGRKHTEAWIDELAETLNASLFVLGHQPAPQGVAVQTRRSLLVASDHESGVGVGLDMTCDYDCADELAGLATTLASV